MNLLEHLKSPITDCMHILCKDCNFSENGKSRCKLSTSYKNLVSTRRKVRLYRYKKT